MTSFRSDFVRRRMLPGTAVLALSGAFAATAASAQAAPDAAAQRAETGAPSDGEILVTARRRAERLQDVPVAAVAVTAAQIRQYDLTSLANVRIIAPEISFDRGFTGSGASISLRGISSSNLDAGIEQSVLLDLDGLPISRGRILNDALFDLQSIEVLKGPQSLFFGKNTPGGVVSIKSAGPTKEFEGYVRTGYETTNDQSSVEAAVSGPLSDSIGYRLAGYFSNSQGYIRNQSPGIADPFRTTPALAAAGTFVPASYKRLGAERKIAGRLTLAYENGGPFEATFKLLGSRYSGQGLQSFSEVMGCPTGVTRPRSVGVADPYGDCRLNDRSSQGALPPNVVAAWPEVRDWNTGGPTARVASIVPTLTMNYKTDNIIFTSVTGLYHYNFRSAGNADATAYNYFWSYNKERFTGFSQEIRVVSGFDGPINFATGGYYEHGDRTFEVGGQNGPNPVDPRNGKFNTHDNRQVNENSAISVFGQITFKPIETVEIAGGARYTREKKSADLVNTFVNAAAVGYKTEGLHIVGAQKQRNTSPEATVTWKPSRAFMIYAAYKTGYLSGGFSNPGTISAGNNLANLTFGAEKAKGLEAGAKFSTLDRKLTGSVTLYRYNYEGLQLTALNAVTAVFQTQNAADTVTQGVEVEAKFRPVEGLSLRATTAYNDAHYKDFAGAQCYAGQTAAQGCIGTTTRAQDLSGRTAYRAPKWTVSGGAVYDIALANDGKVTVNGDVRYTSGYYASLQENPAGYQKRYALFNAGIRYAAPEDKWSLALIGRNLTNRRYATIGVDKPGGAGEVFAVAGEPRSIVLQGEIRF